MKIKLAQTKEEFKLFYDFPKQVYKENPHFRATENELVKHLIQGPTSYHLHATVFAFLVYMKNRPVARFALIRDELLPEYIQVSFFEALPDIAGLTNLIFQQIKQYFGGQLKYVVGINGHLNYGAGFLLDHFDEPPLFGLPYTPPYYAEYFASLHPKIMLSYRFATSGSCEHLTKYSKKHDLTKYRVRKFSKRKLKEEIKIYTYLNNACFQQHPFWANRSEAEDYELFFPFRYLINEENLLFVEADQKPIGFLLWYPDFNQLVSGQQEFNLLHLLTYKLSNPIRTIRFTEIGILPQHRKTAAVLPLMLQLSKYCAEYNYDFCEGGFIFLDNQSSIKMTTRYLERVFGQIVHPYRSYAVYEGKI